MEKIYWTKNLSVGVRAIDRQHKKFVEIANNLVDHLNTKDVDSVFIRTYFDACYFTQTHFEFEEKLYTTVDYFDKKKHIKDHERLLTDLLHFSNMLYKGENRAEELVKFMQKWFLEHVLNYDQHCKPFFEMAVKKLGFFQRLKYIL